MSGRARATSAIGTDGRYAMLDLAAKKGIKPILDEILPMSQAAKAVEAVKTNKVRYRFVLKNDLD